VFRRKCHASNLVKYDVDGNSSEWKYGPQGEPRPQ